MTPTTMGLMTLGAVALVYIGTSIITYTYNKKHPKNKKPYIWEIPDPDEIEFDSI